MFDIYLLQTERLIYLLTTDDIALTGMRFFSITRNFMLAVRIEQDLMDDSPTFHIMQYFTGTLIEKELYDCSITYNARV